MEHEAERGDRGDKVVLECSHRDFLVAFIQSAVIVYLREDGGGHVAAKHSKKRQKLSYQSQEAHKVHVLVVTPS